MVIELSRSSQMSDETPVVLNDDQKKKLKDKMQELFHSLIFLQEMVGKDELTVSTRCSTVGCAENWMGELAAITGYDSDIQKEKEERSHKIRAANTEIRRLEELVGSERGLDGIAEKLSLVKKNFDDHWKSMGFCLTYSTPIDNERPGGWDAGHGRIYFYATLSTHMDRRRDDDPEGLELFLGEPSMPQVLDTPENREYIVSGLQTKYPSLEVLSWSIVQCYGRGCTDMQIRDLVIRIQDITEME